MARPVHANVAKDGVGLVWHHWGGAVLQSSIPNDRDIPTKVSSMSYQIKYTDKHSGREVTHVNNNNEADARGWTKSMADSNGCKAVCEHVADGPYDRSGKVTHVTSDGHDR